MKFYFAVLVAFLATTTVFAAETSPSDCFSAPDPKNCLANVAVAALAKEQSADERLDGMSSLLTSLAKANVRRDDIFALAKDDAAASDISRLAFAISKNTYAFHFGVPPQSLDETSRLDTLATTLRKRPDGVNRLALILTACEARDGESEITKAMWQGFLDRHCAMTDADARAIDQALSGFSTLAAPLVVAYNGNLTEFQRSLDASVRTLTQKEAQLAQKKSSVEREQLSKILFLGHILNAQALLIAGYPDDAVKKANLAMERSNKIPSIQNDMEFQTISLVSSWIYAKAGLGSEAMISLKAIIANTEKSPKLGGGGVATAISVAIETLGILEPGR